MRRSADFSSVVRGGARARKGVVVVHQRCGLLADAAAGPVVGLIVSRAVGTSVTRHRVSRRLRAQLTPRLAALPTASGTVIRALPAAAGATSVSLGDDLDRAFAALARRR